MVKHRGRVVAQASLLVAVVAATLGPDAAGAARRVPFDAVWHSASTCARSCDLAATRDRPLPLRFDHRQRTQLSPRRRTLAGRIDRTGLAYQWRPYPWRPLRLIGNSWHGLLPPPPLLGIYQLQLRLDDGRMLSPPRAGCCASSHAEQWLIVHFRQPSPRFVISSPTSPAINGWRPCDSGRGRR